MMFCLSVTHNCLIYKNCSQSTIGVRAPLGEGSSSKRMPEKKQRDHWKAFIDGLPDTVWNKSPKVKQPYVPGMKKIHQRLRGWDDIDNTEHENMRCYEYGEGQDVEVSSQRGLRQTDAVIVNEYGEVEEMSQEYPLPAATKGDFATLDEDRSADTLLIQPIEETTRLIPRQPRPHLLEAMDNVSYYPILSNFTLTDLISDTAYIC